MDEKKICMQFCFYDNADFQDKRIMYCVFIIDCVLSCSVTYAPNTLPIMWRGSKGMMIMKKAFFFFDWLKVLSGTSNQNLSLRFSPSETSQHIATGNCTDILCWLKFTRSDNHHTAVQRRHYYTLKVFPNCENWLLNFIFPNNTKKGIKFWENWRFRL